VKPQGELKAEIDALDAQIAEASRLGKNGELKYIEVPGGLHSDVVAPNMPAIVEFFDAHRKTMKPTSQQ